MLNSNTIALWTVQGGPDEIPQYWRTGTRGYNVRRVLEKVGGGNRLDKRWVLCKHNQRIWEVPSTATPQGAMEQAEEWLREMGLIQVFAR